MKPHSQVKRKIKSKSALTLPPNLVINILITYHSMLPEDRDFLFELELLGSYDLDHSGGIFTYVVDALMTFIQVKNTTNSPIVLLRHIRLGIVVEYAADGCYQVLYKSTDLAACSWRTSERYRASAINATAVDPNLEYILLNGVTVYGNDEVLYKFSAIVEEYNDVFTDIGATIDVPED